MCFYLQLQPLTACSAVLIVLAVITARGVDSRLPPKLLKVASGAGKALYARGYGYSVIPIPQKILLQSNVARREIFHSRPPRRIKRPRRGKRPQAAYAPKYQDYRPTRKRRPLPIREPPDYHEQQDLDEDFEYDDRSYREFEDFVTKHSELYADGYNTRSKPSRSRYKDEEGAYTENTGQVYARRPRPNLKNWSGRTSSKLYSAAIALPPRYQREENEYDDEEDDNYDYNRGRYRDEDPYREDRYGDREEDRGYYRDRYRDWDIDDIYHDRAYRTKQDKFRRTVGDKTKVPRQMPPDRNKKYKTKDEGEPKWKDGAAIINWTKQNDHNKLISYDKGRWESILPEPNKWKQPPSEQISYDGSRGTPNRITEHRQWPVRSGLQSYGNEHWKDSKKLEMEEWKEPDIITKQNADRWEGTQEQNNHRKGIGEDWIKEHSVGYGIEIEGGQRKKKAENSDPDVVYGHSGNSRPRVPDLGYGQGMETVDDKITGWQVYLR